MVTTRATLHLLQHWRISKNLVCSRILFLAEMRHTVGLTTMTNFNNDFPKISSVTGLNLSSITAVFRTGHLIKKGHFSLSKYSQSAMLKTCIVMFNACWNTSGALPLIWFNFLSQSQFPLPSRPWQNRSLHVTNGYFHSAVLLVWSDTCFRVLICRWQEPGRFEKTIYPHVNTHYSRPAGKCVVWCLELQWCRVKCWPSMVMWDAGEQKAHTSRLHCTGDTLTDVTEDTHEYLWASLLCSLRFGSSCLLSVTWY